MKISYSRVYMVLVLLMAVIFPPFPYSAIAAFLLLLHLYLIWKNPLGSLLLPVDLLSLVAAPFLLDIVIPYSLSSLAIIPALPLLDGDLRNNSDDQPLLQFAEGIRVSTRLKLIVLSLSIVFLLSIMTATYILILSVAIVGLYMVWRVLSSRHMIVNPFSWPADIEAKAVAGDRKLLSFEFSNKTGKPLLVHIEAAQKWASISNTDFTITDEGRFDITIEPPLSGPQALKLKVSASGQMGLLQAGYIVDCARLVVIPRAKYSVYLAKKYLEGGAGASISYGTSLADSSFSLAKGTGIEYHSSHLYSPGDRITDVDWKHTAHYRELVVKKFQNDYGNSAIVLVNLRATSNEEADILASNLVNSVLALAMSSIQGALAAYDEHRVIQQTPVMPSNVLLKNVLDMIESISFEKASTRYLSPPNMSALNRTRRKLANVDLEPAKKLLDILDMEIGAAKTSTSHHPLSLAISKFAKHVPPPATIVPITAMNHDTEALSYLLPNLQARGYRILATRANDRTLSSIGITSS